MKIDYLKVNGYGKIKNKEINLKNNINIIQGKNEAGKSTILNFIHNMFYGASKNKNGKAVSDFDKYKPWNYDEFSGKIKYTLDNEKSFEIFREFKKKNPIIYNQNLDDISSDYIIDKTKGIDFLNEQIGIDEATFENTVITRQDGIKIDKQGQNHIIQKISNLVSSGDESISFKKTMEKINKLQLDQIGTSRTTQKPINVVNNNIESLKERKEELENYKKIIEQNDDTLTDLENNVKQEELKIELFKEYKKELEASKIDYAEIDVNKNVEQNYTDKIEELKNKIDPKAKKQIKKEKKSFTKNYILIFIVMILALIIGIGAKFLWIAVVLVVIDAAIVGFTIREIYKFNKKKNSKLKEIDDLEKNINQEIEILNKNRKEREEERNLKEKELKEKSIKKNQELSKKYENMLDTDFIDDVFNMNYDEISVGIKNKENRINELKLQLYTKQTEMNVMREKLDDLSKIQENIDNLLEEKSELESLNNSYNIAKECMESAYEKIRQSLSPKFTSELCNIISSISNGKYDKVKFSDEEGVIVQIENGKYVEAEDLSIGTVDQMYLGLRLSAIKAITEENMPIILDEAFVYFDNERLTNILQFINKNYKNKQVIIFTCSNREKEILKNLNIKYNLIELE